MEFFDEVSGNQTCGIVIKHAKVKAKTKPVERDSEVVSKNQAYADKVRMMERNTQRKTQRKVYDSLPFYDDELPFYLEMVSGNQTIEYSI